jgi:hypothetical protein
MRSAPLEIAVRMLASDPSLFSLLVEKLLGKAIPGTLRRVDSTVQWGAGKAVRSDVLFRLPHAKGWIALDVELRLDRRRAGRWPVLISALQRKHRTMGDLVILTPHRHIAEWANKGWHAVGPHGTQFRVVPLVLWPSDRKVGRLLDEACPQLAFFAAWAVHHRHDKKAIRVAQEAVRIARSLPEVPRQTQIRAIFTVSSPRLRSHLDPHVLLPKQKP